MPFSANREALIDRLLISETYGPDSGLYKLIDTLCEANVISVMQAIGIARAIKYAVSNADTRDMQLAVGSSYLSDLEALVEVTGKRQQEVLDASFLLGSRPV